MFDYETLEDANNLELALQLIPDEEISQTEEKENVFQKLKNYFSGNSNVWYTYEFDEKKNEIKYNFPRTFSGDLRSMKNYFSNLFK